MDFWSRLLSPLSSGTTRKDQAKDPAKRLHRFEKEYGLLLTAWRNTSNIARDEDAAEMLEIRLQELTNILSDESRRPLPHPCIQYASIKQIYVPIGKIATTSSNEWIIKEAVLFFATLVESEEEAFVENPTFAASLTNLLVRITSINSVRLGLDTESRVVELAFNITTKIRLDPNVLPAWFKAHVHGRGNDDRNQDSRERFAGRTQKADFPLFYILNDYIHHEGKVGDFARTGLLYIIEAASNSVSLEQWIVESDLSTLMATGLGALYSQLSRKLVIDHPPHCLPPILAFSDYEHPRTDFEIISSCSPGFQSHLETFLSHLLFWQDVLNHCTSVEVKSTLLEHFQVIFLQQLLYPSLLESSDIDGGSSVAVLTYLRRILESLDHPDMINLILHYLLGLPDSFPATKESSAASVARKRKSLDLATLMAMKNEDAATPLLFNLVDLALACLRSRNQQTIHVTLQLVSAILKRHHRYAVITLLKTEQLPGTIVRRTIGAQEQEIEYLTCLAQSIGGQNNFDEFYETVLQDTLTRLETHPCSMKIVAPRLSSSNQRLPDSLPGAPKDVTEHTLRPDDPLLNSLLDLLETFFLNAVETNLSVTEALVDLAICGYMRVEGWLARDPSLYEYDEEEQVEEAVEEPTGEPKSDPEDDPRAAELERLKEMRKCQRRPKWTSSTLPRVLNVLKHLEEQVTAYKKSIPRFEELVQQRREAFQTADAMLNHSFTSYRPTPTQQDTPDRRSFDGTSRSGSPSRPTGLEGLAQRLLSELGTPSRTQTPRGRKEQNRSSGSAISTPGLKAAPVIYSEPGSFSPTNTHGAHDSLASFHIREEAITNQLAAFAAMDQTTLTKRVGLPADNVEPIPLRFGKRQDEAEAESEQVKETQPDSDAIVDEMPICNKPPQVQADDSVPAPETPVDQTAKTDMQATEEVKELNSGDNEAELVTKTEEPIEGKADQGGEATSGEDEPSKSADVTSDKGDDEPAKTEEEPKEELSESSDDDKEDTTEDAGAEAEAGAEAGVQPTETGQQIETSDKADTQPEEEEEAHEEEAQSVVGEAHAPATEEEQAAHPKAPQTIRLNIPTDDPDAEPSTVSVSHLITNVIVLQSFLLELSSLIQVRASLLHEVRFV